MLIIRSALDYESVIDQGLGGIIINLMPILFLFSAFTVGMFTPAQRNIFYGCFLPLILVALYLTLFLDLRSIAESSSRGEAFEQAGLVQRYGIQVGITAASTMLFLLALPTVSSKFIRLGLLIGVFLGLYLSLIYSKRQGTLEFIFVLMFLFYFVSTWKKFRAKRLRIVLGFFAILFSGIAAVYYVNPAAVTILAERVYGRFFEINYAGLEGFDRAYEAKVYFQNASKSDLMIGQGLFAFEYTSVAGHNYHSGLINLIFKGGFGFAMFYVISLVGNLLFLLGVRDFPLRYLAMFFSTFFLITLSYSPYWSQVPNLFWIGIAFFGPEIFLMISKQNQKSLRLRPRLPSVRRRNVRRSTDT
ncbi:hypothetical protein N9156_00460 [Akkermansiaceae bacterium]|nr:hypothetical protein [Akkermansiaceae bacterium]